MTIYDADAYLKEIEGGITNEEYIRDCSSEQLAEFIVATNQCKKDHLCLVCKLKLCDKNAVMEWLKAKHGA